MPNNQRPDYVAPHKHSAQDVLDRGVLPPVQVAVPTTSGPSTSSIVPSTIEEMDLTIDFPDSAPLWQATVYFSATVQHNTQDGIVVVRILLDSTEVLLIRDVGASFEDTPYPMDFSYTTIVAAGSHQFEAQWSTDTGEASSPALARIMRVEQRPYLPQVL